MCFCKHFYIVAIYVTIWFPLVPAGDANENVRVFVVSAIVRPGLVPSTVVSCADCSVNCHGSWSETFLYYCHNICIISLSPH